MISFLETSSTTILYSHHPNEKIENQNLFENFLGILSTLRKGNDLEKLIFE